MKKLVQKTIPVCLFGFFAGMLNGLLGAGGGIVIVYGLRRIYRGEHIDGRSIYASALGVMIPLSAFSLWRYFRKGYLPQGALTPLVLPAVLGGLAGGFLLPRLSLPTLSRLFAALVLISGFLLVR